MSPPKPTEADHFKQIPNKVRRSLYVPSGQCNYGKFKYFRWYCFEGLFDSFSIYYEVSISGVEYPPQKFFETGLSHCFVFMASEGVFVYYNLYFHWCVCKSVWTTGANTTHILHRHTALAGIKDYLVETIKKKSKNRSNYKYILYRNLQICLPTPPKIILYSFQSVFLVYCTMHTII